MEPEHYLVIFIKVERMWVVNRDVLLVWRKRPFLTWTKRLPSADLKQTLDTINHKPSCYLIPESTEPEILKFVKENHHDIFLAELFRWWPVTDHWETDLTWTKFNLWFEYKVSNLTIDLVDKEVERYEMMKMFEKKEAP